MVSMHQRPTTLVMAGPSARIVTIKRENIVSRSAPAPQRTRWQCSICGKLLSSKRSYDEHLNIHNQARPFTCDHCDYAAASQMTLRRHILRNHTSRDDWHYKCPYCGETYMEPASYQQHVSSRHFGRSATFGCPFTACTFQTKCSKHFREHLVKHHSCPSTKRNGQEEGEVDSSSVGVSAHPSSLTDENLQQYLVDDDLGMGFGRRLSSLPLSRPVLTNMPDMGGVFGAVVDISPNGRCTSSQEISSAHANSRHALPPPPRRMVVLKKTERINDELLTLPSTSSSSTVLGGRRPSSIEDVHALSSTDDDFMKAPLALRRSTALPPRMTSMRVQLGGNTRRPLPPSPPSVPPTRRVKIEEGMAAPPPLGRLLPRPPSPPTLGGSRHAPAMISADAHIWMIEHEEEVDETTRNVHVYHNGSIDFECD